MSIHHAEPLVPDQKKNGGEMDGQRNFNRTDRNCGSGIYRCSDYGKKEISKNDRRLQ